jgi:hypothetical protein
LGNFLEGCHKDLNLDLLGKHKKTVPDYKDGWRRGTTSIGDVLRRPLELPG